MKDAKVKIIIETEGLRDWQTKSISVDIATELLLYINDEDPWEHTTIYENDKETNTCIALGAVWIDKLDIHYRTKT